MMVIRGCGLRKTDVDLLVRIRVCHHNSLFCLGLLNPCLLHIRETAAVLIIETLYF